jgi:hypothetical protein
MNGAAPELKQVEMPPQALLMQMGMGFIVSQAISVACKLYIADHLKTGAKTVEELAALTETDAPSLYRLMRALTSVGVFHKAENYFSNTALSEFLRSDNPESLRGALHMSATANTGSRTVICCKALKPARSPLITLSECPFSRISSSTRKRLKFSIMR